MVRFTFPQAASTAATGWGSGDSCFAVGSASTTVQAESGPTRPFTHQLSESRTPGSKSADLRIYCVGRLAAGPTLHATSTEP
jgi:hypothetical protein